MIKFDQQERITVDAIGRFTVLLLNGVAVAAAIVSCLLSKEGIRNHIAAAYCSTMSACVCIYFFQWGKLSEGQWGTAEGVMFVSIFCASTSLVPAILFFQLRVSSQTLFVNFISKHAAHSNIIFSYSHYNLAWG